MDTTGSSYNSAFRPPTGQSDKAVHFSSYLQKVSIAIHLTQEQAAPGGTELPLPGGTQPTKKDHSSGCWVDHDHHQASVILGSCHSAAPITSLSAARGGARPCPRSSKALVPGALCPTRPAPASSHLSGSCSKHVASAREMEACRAGVQRFQNHGRGSPLRG